MALRAEQVELTRTTVLEAFIELATETTTGNVTVAAVAERSGVSPATIYRHFPNRDALVHAAATLHITDGVEADQRTWGVDDLAAHLRVIWRGMAESMPLARQAIVTETGRELRAVRFEEFRTALFDALERAGLDRAATDTSNLVAGLALITSAPAFLDLHDRQGHDADRAVEVVTWCYRRLLTGAGLDPARFAFAESDSRPPGAATPATRTPDTRTTDTRTEQR